VKTVELSEVCELITDGTHYTPPNVGIGMPFLTVTNMTKTGLDFKSCSRISTEEFIKAKLGNNSPKCGDLLFSKDGTVGKLWVVAQEEEFAVLSSIAIVRPISTEIDVNYLKHYLSTKKAVGDLDRKKTGSALRRVILKDLKILKIPLPPLHEQKRIAAILDQADALRQKRQQALDHLNQLGQSIFYEMFGDPNTNPKGWVFRPLGELARNRDGDRVPLKKADRSKRNGAYPYYGASGVIDNIDDHLFDGEYLLLGEDGANLLARSSAIAFIAQGKFWVNNHAHVLEANGKASLEFIRAFIESIDLTRYVTGSAQPKLNQKQLNRIPIFCPPMELQEKFEGILDHLQVQKNVVKNDLEKLDTLFASLQQRAFKGEL